MDWPLISHCLTDAQESADTCTFLQRHHCQTAEQTIVDVAKANIVQCVWNSTVRGIYILCFALPLYHVYHPSTATRLAVIIRKVNGYWYKIRKQNLGMLTNMNTLGRRLKQGPRKNTLNVLRRPGGYIYDKMFHPRCYRLLLMDCFDFNHFYLEFVYFIHQSTEIPFCMLTHQWNGRTSYYIYPDEYRQRFRWPNTLVVFALHGRDTFQPQFSHNLRDIKPPYRQPDLSFHINNVHTVKMIGCLPVSRSTIHYQGIW